METNEDHYLGVLDTAADGLAALQIHWTGTHGGTLHGPGLELPATGKPIEGDATMWVRTSKGRAHELRHHLDVLTLRKQVGAL